MSNAFNPSDADYDNLDMRADEYDEMIRAQNDLADAEDGVTWRDDFDDDDDNVIARWYDAAGEWELIDDAHYPGM